MKKKILIALVILLLILILVVIASITFYNSQIEAVNSENIEEETIEIEAGESTTQILEKLYASNLIKNTFIAKIYVRLNGISGLQAGKYTLNTGMDLQQILQEISSGNTVNEEITITFLEGKNMRWIANKIAEETNNTEEDVFNLLDDEEYIQSLIDEYWFLTDEITNDDIYYPLEGYLYPNTYNFENVDVTVEEIFKVLLDEMDEVLSENRETIENTGLTVHQLLTIASIAELEGNDAESRAGIVGVIYNRLTNNMSLGSDVTTYYAIQVDVGERDLYVDEINEYNPYNTRGPDMEGKLPVGPISTVSVESINAVLNPTSSDYLYFVSDINGNIHFTSTYEEHQELISELQRQGLWYEYE